MQFPVNSLVHTEKTKSSIKACSEFTPVLNLLMLVLVKGSSLSDFYLFIFYSYNVHHMLAVITFYLRESANLIGLPVVVSSAFR